MSITGVHEMKHAATPAETELPGLFMKSGGSPPAGSGGLTGPGKWVLYAVLVFVSGMFLFPLM
jgi:hypothetical protein